MAASLDSSRCINFDEAEEDKYFMDGRYDMGGGLNVGHLEYCSFMCSQILKGRNSPEDSTEDEEEAYDRNVAILELDK